MSEADSHAIDEFLASHGSVDFSAALEPGERVGDWRVTAFLGRGGSGEVYRVVHVSLGSAAALKVCVGSPERDPSRDAAACARFRREVDLISKIAHTAFPRLFDAGEREGRPWYVMELLEQRPLPTAEKDIVRFLLAVASGVSHLHSLGLVHRDIKPGNILWRRIDGAGSSRASVSAEPVIIDLGLAKDMSEVRGHKGDSLSIVDGRAVGVGTPRYAAPEQLSGGNVTPAADVYALGMLASDCFPGNLPRAWRRIVSRATAAVPAHRYGDARAFMDAVAHRNRPRVVRLVLLAVFASVLAAFAFWRRHEALMASEEERARQEHEQVLEMLQRDVY